MAGCPKCFDKAQTTCAFCISCETESGGRACRARSDSTRSSKKKWLIASVVIVLGVFLAGAVSQPKLFIPDVTTSVATSRTATTTKSICYVVMEHPDVVERQQNTINRIRARLEELSGLPCVVIHFTNIKKSHLSEYNVQTILLSGVSPTTSKWDPRWLTEFYAFLREVDVPTIGFCGGHHRIAFAFGGKVGQMRLLRLGEKDPNPAYHPGTYKEWGFKRVTILKRDPLFHGLGDVIVVQEFHAYEVKELPFEFEILASTNECRIQVIKHRSRLLYGTQFHPEAYDEEHSDGKIILQNFFRLVGILPSASPCMSSPLKSVFSRGTWVILILLTMVDKNPKVLA